MHSRYRSYPYFESEKLLGPKPAIEAARRLADMELSYLSLLVNLLSDFET